MELWRLATGNCETRTVNCENRVSGRQPAATVNDETSDTTRASAQA